MDYRHNIHKNRAYAYCCEACIDGKIVKILLLFAFFSVFLTLPAYAGIYGQVVSVADGETLTVLTADNEQIRVRLYVTDAPEKALSQAYLRALRVEPLAIT